MDKLDERENTVSTLLIPECLLKEFYLKNKKRKEHFTVYLRKLLRRYRTVTHTGLLKSKNRIPGRRAKFRKSKLSSKKHRLD